MHLVFDDLVGQAELGDPVRQHATGYVQRFEDRHVVPPARQLARRGQATWPPADDGNAPAGRLDVDRLLVEVASGPVGDEPLEVADRNGCTFATPHAFRLALVLLRAHSTRHSRQGVVGEQRPGRCVQVTVLDVGHECGNVDCDRAALDARRPLACQATLGLEQRKVLRETDVHLVEALRAQAGVASGHLLPIDRQPLAFGEWLAAQPALRHS